MGSLCWTWKGGRFSALHSTRTTPISTSCAWRAGEWTFIMEVTFFFTKDKNIKLIAIFSTIYISATRKILNLYFIFFCNSYSERLPHPRTVGNAQLYCSKAPGPYHLPDRGGGEQRQWQGQRAPDAVNGHQNHPGPQEECQGGSFPIITCQQLNH